MTAWDGEGRPAQWITETEPEWDDDSRARVLALLALEKQTHHRCGHFIDEAISTDHGVRVHHEPCQFCLAIKVVQDKYHAEHKDKDGRSDVHEQVWWAEPIPLPEVLPAN